MKDKVIGYIVAYGLPVMVLALATHFYIGG